MMPSNNKQRPVYKEETNKINMIDDSQSEIFKEEEKVEIKE